MHVLVLFGGFLRAKSKKNTSRKGRHDVVVSMARVCKARYMAVEMSPRETSVCWKAKSGGGTCVLRPGLVAAAGVASRLHRLAWFLYEV